MRFWRVCRAVYAEKAATGEGARLYGGRWNTRGVPVVYASTSLALAAVETFVNLEPGFRSPDLVSIEGEVPEKVSVETLPLKSLPAGWHESRDELLHKFGNEWVRSGKSAALLVPSAAIRGEWNVLLNPAHGDFRKLKIKTPTPFEFDLRMYARR